MEKIIYLEADEEITSVVDRLKSASSKTVALIVPRGATIVSGIVNLKLLRREADKVGKTVSLVTTDKTAKNLASQVGIEVFDQLDDAIDSMPEADDEITEVSKEAEIAEKLKAHRDIPEIKYKKMPRIEKTKKVPSVSQKSSSSVWKKPVKFNWKYALGVFFLLAVGAAFTAFFLLPKATIALTLNSEDFNHNFRIKVDKSIRAYSSEENAIPGQVVTTTKVVSKKASATGKKDVGKKATGTIMVYNSWSSESQSFPAGTKFRSSSGKTYVSNSAFTIPGASVAGGKLIASSAKIQASAVENGDQYNGKVGKMTITAVPTAQQSAIYGEGLIFSGGFTKQITVVSKKDAKKAKETAISEATQNLQEEIKKKVSPGSEIAEEALAKEIIEEDISPGVDKETKDFEVKVKVKISTLAYAQKDLEKITNNNIQKVLDGRVLVDEAEKKITKKLVSQDLAKGIMNLDISVVAQVGPEIDEKVLRENISGKSKDEAGEYLKNFDQVKEANISLWPFWVKKVPGLEDSVKIEFKYVPREKPKEGE